MIQKQEDKFGALYEGTDSTSDLDNVSLQTSSSRSDGESPALPLKQPVTIGSTDSRDIRSLMDLHAEDDFHNRRLSDQHVSEIFLRETNSLYSNTKSSKISFFVEDLQALCDRDEAQETAPSKHSSSGILIKTCSFGGVEIREYPIIPGDSPAGFKGPPLTIDWAPISTVRFPNVDKYESVRSRHRRTIKELSIPASQRMTILTNQGYTQSEIQKSTKDATRARRQRRITMSTLKYQVIMEKIESIQRKTVNVLTFGQHNKDQKEYLKKYLPSHGVIPTPMVA
ncbi:unnamed protein product [Cylindrotheca closterium]|uniref:Uncharacterized protein n=1 Tax=Cylindrotheca closterium TaxID=2856 RepID=A0AAD2FEU8_9STRA|nr:unnamed protein product [Cylindrotheca closterium]